MYEISVDEFVRRLRRILEREGLVAFFLGAGASISSGIPGAASLTERWVRELYKTETGESEPFDIWSTTKCPAYDQADAARSYATVMRRLFPTQAERQEEIERVVTGRDPGFAYATLAQLMAKEPLGDRCNIVLTTNFDDLVADALYLYTRVRPLVVTHEALVSYAAVGRRRPTVIKLHGDAMLQPRNTEEEVAKLAPGLIEALRRHLHSRALVVIGYGGNDSGVFHALSALPKDTITRGIYWINDRIPENELGTWLKAQDEVCHVRHLDFDELMAIVKTQFELPHPDDRRFGKLMDRYRDTFSDLQEKVRAENEPTSVVARSVEQVRREFGDWNSVELEAQKFKRSDPDLAQEVYEQGIAEFPHSAALLGNYAFFLTWDHRDDERSTELYERALQIAPDDAQILRSYANFLWRTRGEIERAENLLVRAIKVSPKHAQYLSAYAVFLEEALHDFDRAEALYANALAADAAHVPSLLWYADFLQTVRRDYDRAQALYERAIAIEPENVDCLGYYANFLNVIRCDYDRARDLMESAVRAHPDHADSLGRYATFLANHRLDDERAKSIFEQAMSAVDEDSATYEQAITVNFAGLLYGLGEKAKARELVERARTIPPFTERSSDQIWVEVAFYRLANDDLTDEERAATLVQLKGEIERGVRSRHWTFSINLERAAQLGKKPDELEFLQALADVLKDELTVDTLEQFSNWWSNEQR